MYWAVNEPGAKVMSFDLDNEHITSIRPLPNVLSRPGHWYLTEVRGRLGIVFSHISPLLDKTEVWVMEHACHGGTTDMEPLIQCADAEARAPLPTSLPHTTELHI
jgi:hypothetical protein